MADARHTLRQHRRENPFIQVDKGIMYDTRISWKAKGLMIYLLGQKEGWQFYSKEIVGHSTDGRDSTENGLKELEKNGYLIRVQHKDNAGRFLELEWNVYEIPIPIEHISAIKKELEQSQYIGNPTGNGFSGSGLSVTGKAVTNNNKRNNNKPTDDEDEIIRRIREFEKLSGIDMTPEIRREDFEFWLGIWNYDLIMEATRIAAKKATNINMEYIQRILTGWERDNITTAEQAGLDRLRRDIAK